MSIKVIACGVFRTDLQPLLEKHRDELEVTYLEGGLHSEPHKLRDALQEEIERETEAERIVLLYGLCGTGSAGLRARNIPLVIPRVHDCISLFLGSDAAYARQFRSTPGTYYISAGWYEEQIQPKGRKQERPSSDPISLSSRDTAPEELEKRYGKENADAILNFTHSWKRNYKRAVFIDTGGGRRGIYRDYVDAMGREFGWETETIAGSTQLIEKALNSDRSDGEVLLIPPGKVSYFDSATGRMEAGDPETPPEGYSPLRRSRLIPGCAASPRPHRRIGLGIDAGGTYTDTALFNLEEGVLIAKSKALTTPWNYTEGITAALAALPKEQIQKTELVSVSTTLATNAIVEENRQSVGLLLMPLGGELPAGISHTPTEIVSGRLSITGEVLEEIDESRIRRISREMVAERGVRAFAVSGYGGSINPAHEARIAEIIRQETGLMVCAGHELSGRLDFTVRAATAVLNAGIIPHLETFFHDAETCLRTLGIEAPVLFVRGDGFLMNAAYAMEHPIETALSGPAASIAGARYLTGLEEAAVIDVGGTTSDIGYIRGSAVESDPDGAMIGPYRTHVQAVDMVTLGLGGDSEIVIDRGKISVGPRRVTPLCRLDTGYAYLLEALLKRLDDLSASSSPLLICRFTGKEPPFHPDRRETAVLRELSASPLPVLELSARVGLAHWRFLKLQRLLSVRSIELLGLTPTDLLRIDGRLDLGSAEAPVLGLRLHTALAGLPRQEYTAHVWQKIRETLAGGLIAKLLDLGADDPAVGLLVGGGSSRAEVSIRPGAPIVGLGAAARYLLEGFAALFGDDPLIPEHADVANALGAITSSVHAVEAGSVLPASPEGFRITGSGEALYPTLIEAQTALEERLVDDVRRRAAASGTSETAVLLSVRDRIGETAFGDTVLLERCMEAEIRGLPDLV
jgi:N-methylhydantoinase A/oxoprolinase/acetone carboxylase beta subunit